MLGNKDEYRTVDGHSYGSGRQRGRGIMNNPAEEPNPSHIQPIADKLFGDCGTCTAKRIGESCK